MLTDRVIVDVEHVGRGFADLRLEEAASGDGVDRPPSGSVIVSVPCRTCGTELAVEVCSRAEASRRRGRARFASVMTGITAVLTILLVVISFDAPLLSLLFVLIFGFLGYVTLVSAREAGKPGVYGPWPPSEAARTVAWSRRRRARDHRLTVHPG